MDRSRNLIVDTAEYEQCKTEIKKSCVRIDDTISKVIEYLNQTSESGLKSGQAAEAFADFVAVVAELNGIMKKTGKSIASDTNDFLNDIDDADDLLFKKKGYKPLTDEEFRVCFSMVENTVKPELGFSLIEWIASLFDKYLKFIWKSADIKVTVDTSSSELAKSIDNLKEKTVEKLSTIQANVKMCDRVYRQKINSRLDVLESLEKMLSQILALLTSGEEGIDLERLKAIKETLKKIKNEQEQIAVKGEVITDEDVKYFADNVDDYFGSTTVVIETVCASSLGELVSGDFEKYRATVNAARDYFNRFSSEYTISHDKYVENKEKFDTYLDLYNKYGSKWMEQVTGDKEAAKLFNEILKKTGDVSGDCENYVDIWFQLFCDMTESKEAFERFKNNCDLNDKSIVLALERVEDLYNQKFSAYLADTLEEYAAVLKKELTKKGVNAAIEAYNKMLPSMGVDKIMTTVASNVLKQAYSEAPQIAKYEWILTTENSFNNALAKLRNATPGSEGYDELVQTVREAFDCAKQARVEFFESMAAISKGQQKRYFELNAESARTMSLSDSENHSAVRVEDYFGSSSNIFTYVLDGEVDVEF